MKPMNERSKTTEGKKVFLFAVFMGLTLGSFCGFTIEQYRLAIAWDKVTVKYLKVFVEWYEKLNK